MKKLLALALASAMALSLVACGSSDDNKSGGTSTPSTGSSTSTGAGSSAEEPVELSGDLVLYSSMTDPDLDALINCFNEKYPDIEVEVVNGSAGELTTRLTGEASNPVGDLVWGGMADSDGDRYADIFESWVSVHDAENMPGYTSPNGLYSMDHLSTVVFCINKDLEAELGLEINSYEDLLDPKLKGQIVTADPNSSSSAGFKSVQQGEYAVGLTYEDGAVTLIKDGADNIRLQYPEEGTSATAFGVALVKNGPNPENAKAMIDFICSAEGQTALAAYQEGTLRYTNANYEAPENAWLAPSSDIKWVDRDVSYLTENKDAILEHWNELWAEVMG